MEKEFINYIYNHPCYTEFINNFNKYNCKSLDKYLEDTEPINYVEHSFGWYNIPYMDKLNADWKEKVKLLTKPKPIN